MIGLHAGPPPANPPIILAIFIVAVSVTAPLLFSLAAPPNLLLGTATVALAVGGVITLRSAISAARRQRADDTIRLRAGISREGIWFYRRPDVANAEFFALNHIKRSWLTSRTLIVDTNAEHPMSGRHRLEFTKLVSPREPLTDAIATLNRHVEASSIGPRT